MWKSMYLKRKSFCIITFCRQCQQCFWSIFNHNHLLAKSWISRYCRYHCYNWYHRCHKNLTDPNNAKMQFLYLHTNFQVVSGIMPVFYHWKIKRKMRCSATYKLKSSSAAYDIWHHWAPAANKPCIYDIAIYTDILF